VIQVTLESGPRYLEVAERARNDAIARAFRKARSEDQDIELITPVRLILHAPDGGRWQIVVDNAGNLSTVALT